MPLDPVLVHGFNPVPYQYNPVPLGPDMGQAVQTANQMMQFKQNQQQAGQQNALRGILGAPGAIDESGQPTAAAMQQVMAVDPNAGMKLQQNALAMQQQQYQVQGAALKRRQELSDISEPIRIEAYKVYNDTPGDEATKQAAAQKVFIERNTELKTGGGLSSQESAMLPSQFDLNRVVANSPTIQAQLAKQREEALAKEKETRADATQAETARHNRATEGTDKTLEAGWQVVTDPNAKDADGKSVPMQFRYNARTGQATTLGGEPYKPGGAEKLGTGAATDDKPMTDQAVAYAGTMYRDKGTLPSFGNSKYAVADRKKIIDWAANRDNQNVEAAGTDVVTQAGVKADTASLAQTTKYRNQVESFEETAQQSAGLIRSLAPKGLGPTGIPVIDGWMQAGRKAVGNADVVKFGNAIDTFTSEYAKIMSGATGAAGSTDSARQKAEGLINKAQNAESLYGALDVMQKEMNIRRKSLTDQEAQIRKELGRTGGKKDADEEGGGKADPGTPSKTGTAAKGDQPAAVSAKSIDYLKAHPESAAHFDDRYGAGASKKYLGDQGAAPATPSPAPAAGQAAPPSGGHPVPQEHASDPDGMTYNVGKWVKRGNFVVPGQAASGPSAGGAGDPLAQARAAIASGAPRDAVIKRLRDNGIDPAGL
jgi:hypothetical protein